MPQLPSVVLKGLIRGGVQFEFGLDGIKLDECIVKLDAARKSSDGFFTYKDKEGDMLYIQTKDLVYVSVIVPKPESPILQFPALVNPSGNPINEH